MEGGSLTVSLFFLVVGLVRKGQDAVFLLVKSLGGLEKNMLSANRIAAFAPVLAVRNIKRIIFINDRLFH